jgi:hypothetical protein
MYGSTHSPNESGKEREEKDQWDQNQEPEEQERQGYEDQESEEQPCEEEQRPEDDGAENQKSDEPEEKPTLAISTDRSLRPHARGRAWARLLLTTSGRFGQLWAERSCSFGGILR